MVSLYEQTKAIAQDVINKCGVSRKFMGQSMFYVLPGGDGKYPSFWVQDTCMMAESGLFGPERTADLIDLILRYGQNGPNELKLENGLKVPPWAIADHINTNGRPVYFPGTYKDGNWQGDGHCGFFPPCGYNYNVIRLVDTYIKMTDDRKILEKEINGMSIAERIKKLWEGFNIDDATQMCESHEEHYCVDYGFCDTVKKTGLLLFPSLLRATAAGIMADYFEDQKYIAAYNNIKDNLITVFFNEKDGFLFSATKTCRQNDVWGTAFAVFSGLLPSKHKVLCQKALAEAYLTETAVKHGYVRHLRTCDDWSDDTAWESINCTYGYYMNGGWWSTPTGWYFGALYDYDKQLALSLISDFCTHTAKYQHEGAPFEWIYADGSCGGGKWFGTSGVLPYIAFSKVFSEKR